MQQFRKIAAKQKMFLMPLAILFNADILVAASSRFSYSAALLSRGAVICDPQIYNSP